MSTIAPGVWLESCLAPFADWLGAADVSDIYVNRPCEVWVERLGGTIEQHAAADLTSPALHLLARQIAALNSQGISREQPLLAASLPDGSRVQVVLPPATRGDLALAIRRHVVEDRSLADYRTQELCPANELIEASAAQGAKTANDHIDILTHAVRQRKNILISGGTSTGKTTFLNALMRECGPEERLILIEDTAELRPIHANHVGLLAARGGMGEAQVTADDLLIASLRMRPDRIILGEIRGQEALTFLRAINTGHPGSMSTIHADSPEGAIDQLALLILQSGSNPSWENVRDYASRSIDLVVQLERKNGVRGIAAVKKMTK